MFVISQSENYKWPVSVSVPEDGGKHVKQTFTGVFKRLSQTRIKQIGEHAGEDGYGDTEIAREVLVGWEDIMDGETAVDFTTATRDRLLEVPGVSAAIVTAFMESLTGAKRKN